MESKYRRRALNTLEGDRELAKTETKEKIKQLKYEKGLIWATILVLFSNIHDK